MEAACSVGESIKENAGSRLDADTTVTEVNHMETQVQEDVSADVKTEACVQANDYEIERATGNLPARKRFIPLKFRDFRSPDDVEDDNFDDSDYEPEVSHPVVKKNTGTRRRGRPRKYNKEDGAGGEGESAVKKPLMVKVANGFKCTTCNRVFSQKGNLKVHLITHTDERPFACDVENCDKRFRTKENLRRHKLSHLGIKPFECEQCNKKFCSALSLQEHMSRHTDSRPYVCDTCQRAFRQVSCLRRHILTHTGEQPYACEVCNRRFSQAVYLRSHMKVHTGEKPFPCDQCNKAFAHASDLIRHKIIHTGEKPYACSTCQMRFSDPSSRRRHEREHLGTKPYTCHLCSEGFKRAGQLRAHLFRRHGGLKEGVEFRIQDGPEPVCYRIELHETQAATEGDATAGALITKTLDLSSLDQKRIVSLIQNLDRGIVVQEVEVAATEGNTEGGNADLQLENKTGIAIAGMEQVVVPVEVAAMMEAGDGTGTGNVITIAEVGEEGEGGEVKTTYQILQSLPQEGDGSEQQIYEVHYQAVSDSEQTSVSEVVSQSSVNSTEANSVTETSTVVTPASVESSAGGTDLCLLSNSNSSTDAAASNTNTAASDSSTTVLSSPTQPPPDYVNKPDFSSQEYFNWLSEFTESCKMVPIPLEVSFFQKISHVHKTLSDFMASPSGVITDKENFRILMSISKDLNYILNEHLTYTLLNLNDSESSQNQTS